VSEGSGQRQRYCTKCGAEVRPGNSFCTSCGTLLNSSREELFHQAYLPVSYVSVFDVISRLVEGRVSVFFVIVPAVYYGWRRVVVFQWTLGGGFLCDSDAARTEDGFSVA
jgi:hypothetical protein